MFRIDNATAAVTLPTPDVAGPKPNGYFSSGDLGTSTFPTVVSHDILNAIQEEISYVIENKGFVLDKEDNTQLYTAMLQMVTDGLSGYITAVVQDLNPDLGGNLEVNDYTITVAASGTITLAPTSGNISFASQTLRVSQSLAHRGDANNLIAFGTGTHTFNVAAATTIIDTGFLTFRLGGANAQVNTISDNATLVPGGSFNANNTLATQAAVKGYTDTQTAALLPANTSRFYDIDILGNMVAVAGSDASRSTPTGANNAYLLSSTTTNPYPVHIYTPAWPGNTAHSYVYNDANWGAAEMKLISQLGNLVKVEMFIDAPGGSTGQTLFVTIGGATTALTIGGAAWYAVAFPTPGVLTNVLFFISGGAATVSRTKIRLWFTY